tara:strand:- start:626 stop:1057 length:432 start_codon:yes stop_codon:yes gene_type:complete
MAYKSRNLNITRNRASAANTSALTDLNDALSGMNEFKSGVQDLLKIKKRTDKDKQSIQKLVTLQQFKNFSEDMSMKEYEQYKTNFMDMVEKDKIEDYTFPDFEDFYKQRTLATIKGDTYSPSDLKVSYDNLNIEKMNRIMRMK